MPKFYTQYTKHGAVRNIAKIYPFHAEPGFPCPLDAWFPPSTAAPANSGHEIGRVLMLNPSSGMPHSTKWGPVLQYFSAPGPRPTRSNLWSVIEQAINAAPLSRQRSFALDDFITIENILDCCGSKPRQAVNLYKRIYRIPPNNPKLNVSAIAPNTRFVILAYGECGILSGKKLIPFRKPWIIQSILGQYFASYTKLLNIKAVWWDGNMVRFGIPKTGIFPHHPRVWNPGARAAISGQLALMI